ncbi:IclR family transcriptional regulator [Zymobacter sp. IVIA_5232.4 C2]|uniref:IclR family transcriptional regulator n=1 Tax=Zymobacter sp. IVIA_5232.4 C2 TaxID=3394855 RepID=UPI0039C09E83
MVNTTRRIQSVERALDLLEALASSGGEARLSTLAERTSLDKGTVHGLLNTMVSMGYVARHGTDYALGLRLRDLAQPLMDADAELRQCFAPALHDLAQRSGETCYLAVPCGTREYLCVDVVSCQSALCAAVPRGCRQSLTASAIGRVFLAHDPDLVRSLRRAGDMPAALESELTDIVEQGYALDIEEAEPGLHCMAVPLRQQGRVVAALGVAGPAQRLPVERLKRLAAESMSCVFDIVKK